MDTSKYANWEAGDFARKFRRAAHCATSDTFETKFNELADAVEPLEREFCRETVACGENLSQVMGELTSIAENMQGCHRREVSEDRCQVLFGQVDTTVSRIQSMRDACFI